MTPFFYVLAFSPDDDDPGNQALTLAMVASVVANVSGLITGGLYLFLRSNTLSTIGPKNKAGEYERQRMRHQIRRFGPDDPNSGGTMMQPVGTSDLRRMLSDASLISTSYYDKEEEVTLVGRGSPGYDRGLKRPNPLRSNAVYPLENIAAKISRSRSTSPSSGKQPYSGFSGTQPDTQKPITLLPATIYTPASAKNRFDFSSLKPPPSIRNLAMGRHKRDSSMASSATVQIGLRLSNVEDMPPLNSQLLDKAYTMDLRSDEAKEQQKRPSPLANVQARGEDDDESQVADASPVRNRVKDARMKTLPPVPRPGMAQPELPSDSESEYEDDEGTEEEEQQPEKKKEGITAKPLSPTVYQPPSPTKTRLPSPKGVGFSLPSRSNSTAVRSPPPRTNSSSSPRKAPSAKAGEWI